MGTGQTLLGKQPWKQGVPGLAGTRGCRKWLKIGYHAKVSLVFMGLSSNLKAADASF